jgi:hypothetical protein
MAWRSLIFQGETKEEAFLASGVVELEPGEAVCGIVKEADQAIDGFVFWSSAASY